MSNWKAGQGAVYLQIFVVRKFRENVDNDENVHFGDKNYVIALGEIIPPARMYLSDVADAKL